MSETRIDAHGPVTDAETRDQLEAIVADLVGYAMPLQAAA